MPIYYPVLQSFHVCEVWPGPPVTHYLTSIPEFIYANESCCLHSSRMRLDTSSSDAVIVQNIFGILLVETTLAFIALSFQYPLR